MFSMPTQWTIISAENSARAFDEQFVHFITASQVVQQLTSRTAPIDFYFLHIVPRSEFRPFPLRAQSLLALNSERNGLIVTW